jgi:hypothetical protein
MSKHIGHTWNSERWVADRLADAVENGDVAAKQKFGQRLLDGIEDDGWQSAEAVEEGYFLPFTAMDPVNLEGDDLDVLVDGGLISSSRESPIAEGAPLEGKELERWRDIVAERAFAPECATSWTILDLPSRANRHVYIAATFKEDFSRGRGAGHSFIAAWSTYGEAMNSLKAQGFIGRRDYEARREQIFTRSE